MIDQHDFRVVRGRSRLDLLRLTAADEEARIRPIAPATDARYWNGARRERELLEFREVFGVRGCAQAKAHEHGPLTCAWSLEHL